MPDVNLFPTLSIDDAVNAACPWSGKPIAAVLPTRVDGAVVGFRSSEAVLQARRATDAGLDQ